MFSATEHWFVQRGWLDRLARPLPLAAVAAVLGGVYALTLLPGAGYSPDTAEMQFSGRLLCVTHPTGYPTYLLLLHLFSRLVPFGSYAFAANLFSAVCSVLACLVLRLLLLRLGVRSQIATATAIAFGLTPTFWRMSIVAEVYSLHALFLVLVADALLRWRQTGERRAFIVACGLYAASFGNHLTTITLLPGFVFLVLATRWHVLLEPRSAAAVASLVALGVLPYAYPLWRSLDPTTPYLSIPVTSVSDLWAYATGAAFRGSMFAFTPSQLVSERLPQFARLWWADCALLLPLAALGLVAFKDRVVAIFLGLVFVGHLVFTLNYDIPDIDVYFIPSYLVTAVVAGVGLERLFSLRLAQRVPAAACFVIPLALGALHWSNVEAAKGKDNARPMRELLESSRDGAVIVARYNDYMYLLYYTLAEGLGGPSAYVASEASVEAIAAYLDERQPLYLAPLRKWAPPGLPLYSTRLDLRPALRAAGLSVQMVRPGVFRIEAGAIVSAGDRDPMTGPNSADRRPVLGALRLPRYPLPSAVAGPRASLGSEAE
jgi:hypothetical protein